MKTQNTTQLFSTLSNETRVRCLYLIATGNELCVCEMVEALNISQPTASKALNALKTAGLVNERRDANWVYYRLAKEMPLWINKIVTAMVDGLQSSEKHQADRQRLRNMMNSTGATACS